MRDEVVSAAAVPGRVGSRLLHVIGNIASGPLFAVIIVAIDVVWVVGSIVSGFPGRLETIFQAVVAAVTLAMLFVIQHTQARAQNATQRKLDEILRSLPEADNALIALEEASDHEITSAHHAHRRVRDDAVGAD